MPLSLTKKFCESLVEKGIVSKDDLEKARKISAEKNSNLADVMVDINAITREALLTALSDSLGIPPIKLARFRLDEEILSTIPRKTAYSYQVLPLARIGKQLTVAMVDPLNILAIDDLKVMTSLDISPVIVTEEDMQEAISKYFEKSADEEISEIVDDMESSQMEMVSEDEDEVSSVDLLRITEDAPVVKLTNMILSRAVKERASDILVEPMEEQSRVRYRIDGILRESYEPPKRFHQAIVSRVKVMANLDIAERRLPQDGRFRLKIEGRKVDFRVSIVPSSYGEKISLRILDKEQARIDINELGFRERDVKKIQESSLRPHGMILVCGPTGCGKTTTLYSILKDIDDPGKNVITVEDPVEYELKGINQVSIQEDIGLTFSACLRSILRQDPDIVMVGEIRDFSTLDVAVKAALTGHLVLSTLHTNTAAESIVRMINMGIDPFLIAASVEMIVAQRLLRRLCPDCKEPYNLPEEVARKYGLLNEDCSAPRVFKPKGCKRCMNMGYRGRIGITECLKISPKIKDLIFRNSQVNIIEKAARLEGMVTLRENGMENVLEGVAALEDVLRITIENKKISEES